MISFCWYCCWFSLFSFLKHHYECNFLCQRTAIFYNCITELRQENKNHGTERGGMVGRAVGWRQQAKCCNWLPQNYSNFGEVFFCCYFQMPNLFTFVQIQIVFIEMVHARLVYSGDTDWNTCLATRFVVIWFCFYSHRK